MKKFCSQVALVVLTAAGIADAADGPVVRVSDPVLVRAAEPAPVRAADIPAAHVAETTQVRVKDITTIEGIRDNPLVGYGLVVGLNGTGDRRQTIFSTQTLSNILQRMGVQVAGDAIRVNTRAGFLYLAVAANTHDSTLLIGYHFVKSLPCPAYRSCRLLFQPAPP